MKEFKNPTVAAYLRDIDSPQKEGLFRLRETVLGTDSKITEDIKWNNCLVFIYDNKNIAQTVIGKEHTTLIFFDGAKLKDPEKMLTGDGKKPVTPDFPIPKKLDTKALENLVRQAVALYK